jgi:hypothetical protein
MDGQLQRDSRGAGRRSLFFEEAASDSQRVVQGGRAVAGAAQGAFLSSVSILTVSIPNSPPDSHSHRPPSFSPISPSSLSPPRAFPPPSPSPAHFHIPLDTLSMSSQVIAPAIEEEFDYEGLAHDSLAINMLAGSLAGISEHAVMFPVDSIKVRSCFLSLLMEISERGGAALISLFPPLPPAPADSHAGHLLLPRLRLHLHVGRFPTNLLDGGNEAVMARRCFGYSGCGTGARGVLWVVRAGEGVGGRKRGRVQLLGDWCVSLFPYFRIEAKLTRDEGEQPEQEQQRRSLPTLS